MANYTTTKGTGNPSLPPLSRTYCYRYMANLLSSPPSSYENRSLENLVSFSTADYSQVTGTPLPAASAQPAATQEQKKEEQKPATPDNAAAGPSDVVILTERYIYLIYVYTYIYIYIYIHPLYLSSVYQSAPFHLSYLPLHSFVLNCIILFSFSFCFSFLFLSLIAILTN